MARVLGFGVGVFILAFLWTVCLILCLFLTRSGGPDGAIAPLVITGIITVILVFFPRESPNAIVKSDIKIIDHVFIPRMILVVAMCLFAVIGIALFASMHWSKQVRVKSVKPEKRLLQAKSTLTH